MSDKLNEQVEEFYYRISDDNGNVYGLVHSVLDKIELDKYSIHKIMKSEYDLLSKKFSQLKQQNTNED